MFLKNIVCCFMSFLMVYMPFTFAYADAITDAAGEGKNFGSTLNSNVPITSYDSGTNNFTLNSGTANEEVLNINDLFQTSDSDASEFTDTYDDESAALYLGDTAQNDLLDADSTEGSAYRTVLETAQKPSPSLNNDPIWNQTADAITNAELVGGFTGCTTSSTMSDGGSSLAHIPDYQMCERLVDANVSCEIKHNYEVSFIKHISGPTNISSCGVGCVDMWIGRVGDNYLSGWCTVVEQDLTVDLSNSDAVTSATLEYAKWDDYMQVLINDNLVWQGNKNFPPETGGKCELSTSWVRSPNTNITSHFKTDGRKNFKVRASVSGRGEAFGRIRIKYDPEKVVERDVWYPQKCIDKAEAALSGSCESEVICTDGPDVEEFSRTVKVASKGKTWLTVEFDLANNTWKTISPSDGTKTTAILEPVNMAEKCAVSNSQSITTVKTYWSGNPISGPVDTSAYFRVLEKPSCSNGMKGVVQVQDTKTSNDSKYVLAGKFTFVFSTKPADTGNGAGCMLVNGELLCDDFLDPSPVPGISKFCKKVSVNSTCIQTGGYLGCYTDANGEEQCLSNDGTIETNCEELENNPACAFVESNCVEGAEKDGACRIFDDVYDCGYDTEVTDYDVNDDIDCGSEIRCMGTECMDPAESESHSFNKVVATMQIAKMVQNDGDCTDTTFSECQVFKGEALECKKAVGGAQDCCFNASGVSWVDYLKTISSTYKVDNIIMNMNDGSAIRGAWSQIRQPAVDAWSAVKDGWTSAKESVMGKSDSVSAITDLGLDKFEQQAMTYARDFVVDAFGKDASEALFHTSADGVVSFNPVLANIMSTIMLVYAIYQIAMLVIQLMFPCTEEEYELSSKRALRACHSVGSYCKTEVLGACIEKRSSFCCFSSPLSRIIAEQSRIQGIGSWGSAKNPDCSGISITDLDRIDWDLVDLSEWIGMLSVAGELPDPSQFSIETLTGEGSALDMKENEPRENIVERTNNRMDGLDYDEIIENVKAGAQGDVPDVVIPD